jgi:DNA mismatch endonuclease (patch repair protein)
MQGNKSKDTSPELKVRKLLREAGFPGYRLQWKKAPGRPDIAYPGRKIAIFVNGCFWHRCPKCQLPTPKTNPEYWEEKFRRNVERDQRKLKELEDAGWTVFVIWECDLKKPKKKDFEYVFISLEDGVSIPGRPSSNTRQSI